VNALEYLFGLEFHGHKFGLDNIRAITAALGHPEDAVPAVHVAGTNGKGSVCAMLATALRAAGYRTGCYTSPHLVDLEERFQVDGVPLPRTTVEAVIDHVRIVAEALQADGRLAAVPTFFEVATATAFELFRRAAVDVAVLEVGLGGRLDATNVVTPRVAVITNIDLEHQQYLGDSLAAIAGEKAGIIKPGVPVVSGERKDEARAVIRATCVARGAPLTDAFADVAAPATFVDGRVRLTLSTPTRAYPPCTLGLRGRHQLDNALVAVRALEALDRAGLSVPPDAIVAGLEDAAWPGRLDLVTWTNGRALLLDAAHNPAGARTLASYLWDVHPDGVTLVLGAVRDKDHRGMLAALVPQARMIVVTEPPTPRAATAGDLAALVRDVAATLPAATRPAPAIIVEPDPARAIARACEADHLVCVAGSIFLVGAVWALCRAPRTTPPSAPLRPVPGRPPARDTGR
jgi:dihydrofolate synthase / folylpolyglutamate synthase